MMPSNNDTSETTVPTEGDSPTNPEIDSSANAQGAAGQPESQPADDAFQQDETSDADPAAIDVDSVDGQPEPESEQALQERLEQAEARAAENWDRLVRLQAEMENQRKRAQNDVNKARKFALEGIVGDLLPIKDSLEMGLAAAEADGAADANSIVEGAELTVKMLAQVFEKNNIQEVNPLDEKFDPEFHQAMSMQEVEGKEPNTVTNVMQKGYTLNDRLVRPALVMVSK
ncbi:MAG: nucleotide exchange factor GrpE [Granulosicoccus sp.]